MAEPPALDLDSSSSRFRTAVWIVAALSLLGAGLSVIRGGPSILTGVLVAVALIASLSAGWMVARRLRSSDRHIGLQLVGAGSAAGAAVIGATAMTPQSNAIRAVLLVAMVLMGIVGFIANQKLSDLSSTSATDRSEDFRREREEQAYSRISLPPTPDPFVGLAHRQAVDALERGAIRLARQRRGVLLVFGAPGRGKSTVIAEFLSRSAVVKQFGEGRRYVDLGLPNDHEPLIRTISGSIDLLILDHIEELSHDTRLRLIETALDHDVVLVLGWRTSEIPTDVEIDTSLRIDDLEAPHARLLFADLSPEHGSDPRLEEYLATIPTTPLVVALAAKQSRDVKNLKKFFKALRVDLLGSSYETGRESTQVAFDLATRGLDDDRMSMLTHLAALPDGLGLEETELLGEAYAGYGGVLHEFLRRGVAEWSIAGIRVVDWVSRYLEHSGKLSAQIRTEVHENIAGKFLLLVDDVASGTPS